MHSRALLGALCGLGLVTGVSTAQAQTVIEVGYATTTDSHYGLGMTRFGEVLEELSGGAFTLLHHPSSALGGEREMIEQVQLGILDMVITSTGPLPNFVPETQVLDLPFLFRDYDHARGVLDGEIGRELLDKVDAQGFWALAWTENGFRHITNSVRPVRTPGDLQGMKIRTMENPIHLRAFEALGAAPTPMSFAELFTALQQGVVDAQENPIVVISVSNFAEVQGHLSLTGHLYSPAIIIASTSLWESLNEEQRGWFEEAARESVGVTRARVNELEDTGIDALIEKGMQVVTDVDIAPFQAAVGPAWEAYTSRFGSELVDRVVAFE
ncbi:MAG: DctP family TRAP transporter solute-binding subunit [Geminicoccaceae bacterium]|nr:MAG: DctP family TRAP transporter solute-binding subunit [Geminicoccaceae bacterium]